MNVQALSQAISYSAVFSLGSASQGDNVFALVLVCRGHIRVFPLQSHQLESSVTLSLSLSVFLRLSDYSLHPLAQLLIYRALAGMRATRNQHFMSDVLSHGSPGGSKKTAVVHFLDSTFTNVWKVSLNLT